MLTSELIRAARMLLRWDQETLSQKSGVPLTTLKKLELRPGPLATRGGTEERLRAAIESAGVEFTNGGQPGVRLKMVTAKCPKCGFEGTVEDQKTDTSRAPASLCRNGGKPHQCPEFAQAISAAHQALRAVSPSRATRFAEKARDSAPVAATIIAKGHEARGKAETAVDEALADQPAAAAEKAHRKRKLTSVPKELKPGKDR